MYRAVTGFVYFPMYVIVHHNFINKMGVPDTLKI